MTAEKSAGLFFRAIHESLKAIKLDYFIAVVDEYGNVAPEDLGLLAAAESRGAQVVYLTPAIFKRLFPTRERSFNLDDAPPLELIGIFRNARDILRENLRESPGAGRTDFNKDVPEGRA